MTLCLLHEVLHFRNLDYSIIKSDVSAELAAKGVKVNAGKGVNVVLEKLYYMPNNIRFPCAYSVCALLKISFTVAFSLICGNNQFLQSPTIQCQGKPPGHTPQAVLHHSVYLQMHLALVTLISKNVLYM